MKPTRRIAVYTSAEPLALRLDVNQMRSHNAEETLHSYLRRHFEKVSKKQAGQFVEHPQGSQVQFVLNTPPAEVSNS